MARYIDITGRRFGKLVALERVPNQGVKVRWLCQCDCGNKTELNSWDLRKKVKSCGCLLRLKKEESSFNILLYIYKRGAKKRGYAWELSKEKFREIVKRNCFYCGASPRPCYRSTPGLNGYGSFNGIDRIDNNKGYFEKNTVPCCGTCNKAKYRKTTSEFRMWVKRIYHYWGNKN